MKFRLRHASDFQVFFWAWHTPLGYYSAYYDGWNNQINLGFICLCWITPPMKGDCEENGVNHE